MALCTCDGADHLDEQLASIADQQRPPDELVVVDDASGDDTVERLRAFAEHAPFEVRLDLRAERQGPVDSFAQAIAGCRGDAIALCDQDDRWYPAKLRVLEAALDEGALLAFSDADLIDEHGARRELGLWDGVGFRGERRSRFDDDPLAALLNRSTVTGCAAAVRRELAEVGLPFPDELHLEAAPILHDRWLSLVAACIGTVRAVPDRLMAYRVHPKQVTGVRRRARGAHLPSLLREEAGRPLGEVTAAAAATASQLEALERRVGAAEPNPGALAQVADARHHAERRAGLTSARPGRLASVGQALSDGGYRRYASGATSAAADLLRSGRAPVGDPGGDDEGELLFLNHAANETGPPVVLLAFQRWLREHDSRAFTTVHGAGGNLLERFEQLGPNVVLRHRWSPDTVVRGVLERAGRADEARRLGVAASTARLRLALRGHQPAGLYVNALAPVNVTSMRAVLALHPDLPVVSHVHEMSVILEHGLAPDDLRFALDASDHLVVVSDAVRRYLRERQGIDDDRMTTVHEFIDPPPPGTAAAATAVRDELGIGPDAPLVVACGSTDWRKAPDLFLRMAWEQRRRRPDLDVTYAWVGNTRNAYEDHFADFELDRLGLRDRVHFVGVRSDPSSWFAAADVFVLPSREDPFPLVCLEAGSTGTPIVCFDTGGMPELVGPADAGVVVEYPDVVAMADAACALLDAPEQRRRQGANARDAVFAGHLAEQQGPRLHEVVESTLRGRS